VCRVQVSNDVNNAFCFGRHVDRIPLIRPTLCDTLTVSYLLNTLRWVCLNSLPQIGSDDCTTVDLLTLNSFKTELLITRL